MSKDKELKPCPFCGSWAIKIRHEEKGIVPRYSVECCSVSWTQVHDYGCIIQSGTLDYPTEQKAITAWNTRHSPLDKSYSKAHQGIEKLYEDTSPEVDGLIAALEKISSLCNPDSHKAECQCRDCQILRITEAAPKEKGKENDNE